MARNLRLVTQKNMLSQKKTNNRWPFSQENVTRR
uniref:Uncharacterized protein n=1 Tax=Anguilla anguilla TaxID=7936 RepID=A0A0E9PII0_ANGAN